ncbi:hypothetical protein GIB67_016047 [Kingdonia uniflora]|uniref:Uncharacterized protein n=1 Tax=Kingdonia uniflora TaxID=39325 RepID=A0A7J7L1T4_9MAGN|nr:hypothetical protein GIB67_016047 [Kingdonia uniflora]
MPIGTTMFGVLLGLGTQMYSNGLRKLPLMRHPWEHVIGMGLGAIFTNQLVKWDAQLQVDLNKILDKAKVANERRYFGCFVLSTLKNAFVSSSNEFYLRECIRFVALARPSPVLLAV